MQSTQETLPEIKTAQQLGNFLNEAVQAAKSRVGAPASLEGLLPGQGVAQGDYYLYVVARDLDMADMATVAAAYVPDGYVRVTADEIETHNHNAGLADPNTVEVGGSLGGGAAIAGGGQPEDLFLQLVPGNTQGAKHVLPGAAVGAGDVWAFFPKDWITNPLPQGPVFLVRNAVSVLHPTHGPVKCEANTVVVTGYSVDYDVVMKMRRRQQD